MQRGVRPAGHLERAEDAGVCGGDGHLGARALLRRADSATAGLYGASAARIDRHECAQLPGAHGLVPEPARTRQATGRLGIVCTRRPECEGARRSVKVRRAGSPCLLRGPGPRRGPAAQPRFLPERPALRRTGQCRCAAPVRRRCAQGIRVRASHGDLVWWNEMLDAACWNEMLDAAC